ncbi:hypothetical protein NZD88_16005 [Chryseobacterium antibioticum]|uniref:DUF6705 domain-containing protein n=1 Tax=Chryseobacterium pyrolae TaxID=2987481 RepID=A0ABT2IKK1_9FLAO|nr:hypothetical protein [Chryseobacterium pyrolae]MCT2409052.1 hypothetical protein [Chryseobacterium pyrolae]
MKNLGLCLGILAVFSCKAQQEYPLKTDYTEIPNNSYLKNFNNELNVFVGNYTANFQDKKITLFITKQNYQFFDRGKYKYYKDVLSIKFIIKNSSGTILQDTQNITFQPNQLKNTIYSRWMESNNKLLLYYGGTNCSVGWGDIYLQKISSTQISWEYLPNDIVLDENRCPTGTDINIYLPEAKDLIFTKQ